MNFVVTFALGVIVGGITMWQMARQNDHDENEPESSEAVPIEIIDSVNGETDNTLLNEINIEQEDESEEIQIVTIDTSESDVEAPVDKLQQIAGIGPTYSSRIYEAGIESVEDLAKLTAEKLQAIVTPGRSNPTAETEKWLDQARQLATA